MEKRIILLFLIFSSSLHYSYSQNTEYTDYHRTDDFFIHVNIPTLFFSPIHDNNILQSYGFGAEYKLKNKLSLSFNFTREINDSRNHVSDTRNTYSSFIYHPSLRYYIDSNFKFFVNLGVIINSCNDKVIENDVINEEKYMQNAITTGIGYKAYFSSKKRLGIEFLVDTKTFMWESKRNNYWRKTMIDNVLYFNISIFYRF